MEREKSNNLGNFSSHAVFVLLADLTQLSLEIDVDFKVQIALVAVVGLHAKDAVHFLVFVAGNVVFQIEDSLLPVSVGGLGSGGKSHALVAFRKFHLEKSH